MNTVAYSHSHHEPSWISTSKNRLIIDETDHGRRTPTVPASADVVSDRLLDMRREEDRLNSLNTWPISYIDKFRVAKLGLFYFGESDKVKCFFCNLILGEWEEGDDPAVDHERCRPLCPLMRGRPCGNIPLNTSSVSAPPNQQPNSNSSTPSPTTEGQDVCGPFGPYGNQVSGPIRPAFSSEAARLASFADWPCRMKQKPEAMADAGFFYTGTGDKTVCYYCGGGLKDWEDDDDPWEQHARWFQTCHYVKLVKGEDFINKIIAKPTEHREEPKSQEVVSGSVKSSGSAYDCSSSSLEKNESRLCKICFTEERNICFVPCGHVVACPKCALSVQICPVCRQQFTSTMRLYYS